jgi:hypothetical protein
VGGPRENSAKWEVGRLSLPCGLRVLVFACTISGLLTIRTMAPNKECGDTGMPWLQMSIEPVSL